MCAPSEATAGAREPAIFAGADHGGAFLWELSCRDKKVPRLRVREPDSHIVALATQTTSLIPLFSRKGRRKVCLSLL